MLIRLLTESFVSMPSAGLAPAAQGQASVFMETGPRNEKNVTAVWG